MMQLKRLAQLTAAVGILLTGYWLGLNRNSKLGAPHTPPEGMGAAPAPPRAAAPGTTRPQVDAESDSAPESLADWQTLAIRNPSQAVNRYCRRGKLKSTESWEILEFIWNSSPDPEAVWKLFLETTEDPRILGISAYKFVEVWLEKDPEKSMGLIARMPTSVRSQIGGVLAKTMASGSFDSLKSRLSQMENLLPDSARVAFGGELVTSSQMSTGLWEERIAEILPALRSDEARYSAVEWAFIRSGNPINMANRIAAASNDQQTMILLEQVILKRVVESPEAVGNWINESPPGSVRDHSAAAYARAIQLADPEAARLWIDQITDPQLKAETIAILGGNKASE